MSSLELEQNSRGKSSTLILILLFVLICAGGIYYARVSGGATLVKFKNTTGLDAFLDTASLRDKTLLNIKTGKEEELSFRKSGYTLLILLSAGDCPNCLREKEIWSDLIREFSPQELETIGVLSRTSLSEARTLINGLEIPFVVFLDENNELGKITEIPSVTPFKILLKNGKVVLVEGPKTSSKAQTSFGESVRSI